MTLVSAERRASDERWGLPIAKSPTSSSATVAGDDDDDKRLVVVSRNETETEIGTDWRNWEEATKEGE
jgi:hypothetical protein